MRFLRLDLSALSFKIASSCLTFLSYEGEVKRVQEEAQEESERQWLAGWDESRL